MTVWQTYIMTARCAMLDASDYAVGKKLVCIKTVEFAPYGGNVDIMMGEVVTVSVFTHGGNPDINHGIRFEGCTPILGINFKITEHFLPHKKFSGKDLLFIRMTGKMPNWVKRVYWREGR